LSFRAYPFHQSAKRYGLEEPGIEELLLSNEVTAVSKQGSDVKWRRLKRSPTKECRNSEVGGPTKRAREDNQTTMDVDQPFGKKHFYYSVAGCDDKATGGDEPGCQPL
jgi:hypothetical protein